MMKSVDWYHAAIEANGYSADNRPEFLFLSFPCRINKREGEMIELHNRALGYQTTQFYKKKTIMVSF